MHELTPSYFMQGLLLGGAAGGNPSPGISLIIFFKITNVL